MFLDLRTCETQTENNLDDYKTSKDQFEPCPSESISHRHTDRPRNVEREEYVIVPNYQNPRESFGPRHTHPPIFSQEHEYRNNPISTSRVNTGLFEQKSRFESSHEHRQFNDRKERIITKFNVQERPSHCSLSSRQARPSTNSSNTSMCASC